MSFRPEVVPAGDVAMESVNTSKVALKWLNPPTSSFRVDASSFRGFSGTTRGEIELPKTAPLIYPDTGYTEIGKTKSVESQNGIGNGEAKRSASSQQKKVAAAYFDKRAQAKYVSIRGKLELQSAVTLDLPFCDVRHTNIPTPRWQVKPLHNSPPDTVI